MQTPSSPSANDAPLQFLSLRIGKEDYGLQLHQVQELRGYDAVTALPNAPDYLMGVINLRGSIVPVVDLRLRFGCPAHYDPFTVVVVLNLAGETAAIVADSVSDVVELRPEDIKPAPPVAQSLPGAHLLGMGTVQERLIALLDIDQVLADTAVGDIAQSA